jgi:hypothetical protein
MDSRADFFAMLDALFAEGEPVPLTPDHERLAAGAP